MATLSLLLRLLTLALLVGLLGLWFAKRPALQALRESAAEGREQLDLPGDTGIPAVLRESLAELGEGREELARRREAAERLEADNRTLRQGLDTAEESARTLRQELRAARQGLAEAERRAEEAASRTAEVSAEVEEERRARIALNDEITRLREDLLASQRETADLRTRLEQVALPGTRGAPADTEPPAAAVTGPRVEVVRVDAERGRVVLRRPPGPTLPTGTVLTLVEDGEPVARLRLRLSQPRYLLLERGPDSTPGSPHDSRLRLREGSVLTLQR